MVSATAVLRAARVVLTLAREVEDGKRIYAGEPGSAQVRLLLPDVEAVSPRWQYLTARPHVWKRQLYVKGRRLTAGNVWYDMLANKMSSAEAAENWDLPVEAVEEIIRYCEANRGLICMESDEDRRALQDAGVTLAVGSGG